MPYCGAVSFLLEVIASSVEDALEAEAGGAGRVELCIELERGGLTPPISVVREVLRQVSIPVRVMVCENPTYDQPGPDELARLIVSMRQLPDLGVSGVVIGFGVGQTLDEPTLEAMTSAAPELLITFHRVFERFSDPWDSIEKLKRFPQVDHILLCRADWNELLSAARPQIELIAGGGLRAGDFRNLLDTTNVREFHTGRPVREHEEVDGRVKTQLVRQLIRQLSRE